MIAGNNGNATKAAKPNKLGAKIAAECREVIYLELGDRAKSYVERATMQPIRQANMVIRNVPTAIRLSDRPEADLDGTRNGGGDAANHNESPYAPHDDKNEERPCQSNEHPL
jgi:hypothetical protein